MPNEVPAAIEESPQQSQALPLAAQSSNLLAGLYFGTAEQTFLKSPQVSATYEAPYNQDDLWKKHGDYRAYDEMLNDDHVSVCLKLKKDLVLGSGFYFETREQGQEEVVNMLERTFSEECEVSISDAMEEILTCYEYGFSLTEKVFKVLNDGTLGIKFLKTRYPNSWLIHQDDRGNVTRYEQKTSQGPMDVDPQSLIHFVNNRRFSNPYGKSDLRAAYNAWFAKRQVIRYYAIFLEKAASPIPVARYDINAPQTAVLQMHEKIKEFQAKSALTIPKNIEVEFLESSNVGEAYSRAIDIFNTFIGRALFIPDLVGLSGGQTSGGSFALGKEQIKIFFMHVMRRRQSLEALIDKHLVEPLVVYNFGNIDKRPAFKFKQLDDGAAVEFARLWADVVKSSVYDPSDEEINYFRKLVKFPEGAVDRKAPPPNPFAPPALAPKAEPGDEGKEPGDFKAESHEEKSAAEEEKKAFKLETPGNYHKKVDFKAIKAKLDDYDNSITATVEPIIAKIIADVKDQVQKKKIIQTGNIAKAETLNIKYLRELKQALKESSTLIYKDGKTIASHELFKTNYASPVVGDAFLELLESEIFSFVGDWADKLKKSVRVELTSAIKDGKSLGAILDVLDKYEESEAIVSVERFARTKHTEVFNKGRLDFFEQSGVVAAYQYSAILDNVTSDICSGLHGAVFEAGSEPVPPMHWNCRSTLIPITKYEEFKPTEKIGRTDVDDYIDENKGKGFPTK